MSQHDMSIANASFPSVRADINLALVALAENSRGATEPVPSFANQPWADTTSGIFKIRNDANTAWISVFYLATGKAVSNPNTTDASGGVAGLTGLNINFKNVANTFISFFTNTNTAARTYTFQNKSGTMADTADVTAAQAAAIASAASDATTKANNAQAAAIASANANTAAYYVDNDVGIIGVGAFIELVNNGVPLASGNVSSGSSLQYGGINLSGTWRNISPFEVPFGGGGVFQRIS